MVVETQIDQNEEQEEELSFQAPKRESADELRINRDVKTIVREQLRRENSLTRSELRPLADRVGVLS